MAITHVGVSAVQQFSETITLALPVGVQAGDLLIANVVIGAGATVNLNVPASWTIAQNDTPNAFRHAQWIAYAIYDGTSSYQFSLTSVNGARLVVNAYRDVNQTTPVQSSGKSSADNVATINSAVLSVANANSVEFACCADLNGTSITFTPPAGVNERLNRTTYPSMTIYDRSVSPSSTTVQTVTAAPNARMSLMNLVINPAGGGTTPISFTGNIANQTFTVGQSVNVDLSSNWSGTQTPFTFAVTTGLLAGTGLTLSSSGVLSGTASLATQTGIVITGTDADTNTAVSNSFSVTVSAAPTAITAAVAFTMPQMQVAIQGQIVGADPIFTSEPLRDNTNGNLLANEALDYVALYDNTTGALVLRVTGLSTNASGVFSVQNAALTAGVTYKADWKITSQAEARMPAKAAV